MAESITKEFKGKSDWVYVGQAKPEHKKSLEKKPDTTFNEYMQQVFDVAAPVALSEMDEASAVQTLIADETAKQLVPEEFVAKPQGDQKSALQKINEWDTKTRGRELTNRWGKILTNAVYMAGSFGLDWTSDLVANETILKPDQLHVPPFKPFHLNSGSGNKKMLQVGWEFLTDAGIGKAADVATQHLTNRQDVGFISPLSRTLGSLGNTVLNVFDLIYNDLNHKVSIVNSFINPGFIEGAFRFIGAMPGGGIFEKIYAAGNRQIMKGEGAIPFGTDLAYNMLIAKWMNKEKRLGGVATNPAPARGTGYTPE